MNRKTLISLAVLSALSMVAYLLASQFTYRIGFPLDDAWIHQTYARSLGARGEWAFVSGQPSAGSTAPLWSGLLAIGYALGLGPYLWTYFLGWGLSFGLAVVGYLGWKRLCPERRSWAPWAGALLALEWHLAWAAASGMETLLFAALATLTLVWLVMGWERWPALGLLIGLTVWVRPDGVTLAGPAVAAALTMTGYGWRQRLRAGAWVGLGIALPFGLYLLFNHALAGAWWPNTFYAKQAEYAILREIPFWRRFLAIASLPCIGAGALLLPGFVGLAIRAARQRAWAVLAGAAWVAGYLALYAWRLPAVYQHGRYVIPAMPAFFLWGLAGMAQWVEPASTRWWRRVLGKAWVASTGLVLVAFWLFGARAYATDVAIIESEMVVTARWVAANTGDGARVAAHDIGALGYFAFERPNERRLLDLAGLVSPQVVPFIRDEEKLAAYLDAQGADYLVAFPGWYPLLVRRASPIFASGGRFAPQQGGENMTVYRWNPAP